MGSIAISIELNQRISVIEVVALLKACAKPTDLHKGIRLHADIVQRGILEKNSYISSALITMYIKCGSLSQAAQVLHYLPSRTVIVWNALISGYVQQRQDEIALKCFDRMQNEGLSPDTITFTCVLKACGRMRVADKGERMHDEIVRRQLLDKDVVLGTALVDMYVKCGANIKAAQVLDKLRARDVTTWSALIAGYVEQEQLDQAFQCFELMQYEGLSPNEVTLTCMLKACSISRAADKGEQIHHEITRQHLLNKDPLLSTALVDMYAKCGAFGKAVGLLDSLPIQDAYSWSALIAGYAQQGQGEEAMKSFEQMQCKGICPDVVTFISVLNACGSLGAAEKGEYIHTEIVQRDLLGKDIVLGNSLVDMYAKCGKLLKAGEVLNELPVRNVATWNPLIVGHVEQGQGEKALHYFQHMLEDGLSPDTCTFIAILQACSSIKAVDTGEEIHRIILRQGLLVKDAVLGSTLVAMYAKCCAFARAVQILEELPVQNVVSWNALMSGYNHQGQTEDAFNCFERMQNEGYFPSTVTLTCILNACGRVGATAKGKQIHDEIIKQDLLGEDVSLGNTLVDMYAKLGALDKAAQVLDELPVRNNVSWNVLITGYAQHGHAKEALIVFKRMHWEGFYPNTVTLACMLGAYSRSGLVEKDVKSFMTLGPTYGVLPGVESHSCMVNLFGRAGDFNKALAMIKKLPLCGQFPLWHSLLRICRECGNVKLGRFAFDNAVQLDESDGAVYVLMGKIYAAAGMHEEACNIRAMRDRSVTVTLCF